MDLSVFETHRGGDVVIKGNDFELVSSLLNQPYLAMFSGNPGNSTDDGTRDLAERFDYWANELFFQDQTEQQFNSRIENKLVSVALTSAGIRELEADVLADLKYLRGVANVTASVIIDGNNKVKIEIKLQEPTNLQEREFIFLWDGTRLEDINVIEDVIIPEVVVPVPSSLTLTANGTNPDTAVDVSWTDESGGTARTIVDRSPTGSEGTFVQIADRDPGVTTFGDTGLTESTPFFYRVRHKIGALESANTPTETITTFEPESVLFITNAAITVFIQKVAIDNFVKKTIADGVFTKCIIIYLFVGGTASQHKFNLKNPLDTDAAHRVTFSGGLTHNPTGVKPDGVNGKGDTFLNCDSDLPCQDAFYCVYLRDTVEPDPVTFAFGAFNNPAFMGMQPDDGGAGPSPDATAYSMGSTTAANFIIAGEAAADQVGVHIQSRRSSTDFEAYKDKVSIDTNTNSETNPGPTNDTTLWARGSALFNNNQTSFYACGTSLTTTQADDLTDAVTAFRTAIDP